MWEITNKTVDMLMSMIDTSPKINFILTILIVLKLNKINLPSNNCE